MVSNWLVFGYLMMCTRTEGRLGDCGDDAYLHPFDHGIRRLGQGSVSGDDDCFFARRLFAHAHGREVHVRAAAEARAEDLPRERVHDDPNLQLALIRDSDGYRGEL